MNQGNLSRRGFLARSLAGLIGAGLPAWYAQELVAAEQLRAAQQPRRFGPNDNLLIGCIGIGSPQSRGRAILGDAVRQKGVRCVAVCDVDARHRDAALKYKQVEKNCAGFSDYRELLKRKDINAVLIATPDHWHALIATAALRAGKDVYCEKPLSLTVVEGRAIASVAAKTGRIFQVGSQQRSDTRFRLACELVRNGRLGRIRTVETRIGSNPRSPVLPKVAPPKGLDWDFWRGPTPAVDYVELTKGKHTYTRCHYEFRWWYDYSGGKVTDWGAHHNDIAQWGLGMDGSGPVEVEGSGTAPDKGPNQYNCHPDFNITYTYGKGAANGVRLICTSKGENGVRFEGEKGQWIFVSRGVIRASDEKLLKEPLGKNATRLYVSSDHMGNFIDCIRGTNKEHKLPICTAEIGHRSVTVCHIGNIAVRTGLKLRWDPIKERFVGANAKEANGWLSRAYRAPWKLET
jgi:predicted dehydrogenase